MNSCRPLMCFTTFLENNKPEHIQLLEYIKLYEQIKEKQIDLEEYEKKKSEVETQLQELFMSSTRDKEVNQMTETIARFEELGEQTQRDIDSHAFILGEMYESNKDSFNYCFSEFYNTMTQASPIGSMHKNQKQPQNVQSRFCSNQGSLDKNQELLYMGQTPLESSPHFKRDNPQIAALKKDQEH